MYCVMVHLLLNFTEMKPFCPAAERKGLFISVGETMEMMICSVK